MKLSTYMDSLLDPIKTDEGLPTWNEVNKCCDFTKLATAILKAQAIISRFTFFLISRLELLTLASSFARPPVTESLGIRLRSVPVLSQKLWLMSLNLHKGHHRGFLKIKFSSCAPAMKIAFFVLVLRSFRL